MYKINSVQCGQQRERNVKLDLLAIFCSEMWFILMATILMSSESNVS